MRERDKEVIMQLNKQINLYENDLENLKIKKRLLNEKQKSLDEIEESIEAAEYLEAEFSASLRVAKLIHDDAHNINSRINNAVNSTVNNTVNSSKNNSEKDNDYSMLEKFLTDARTNKLKFVQARETMIADYERIVSEYSAISKKVSDKTNYKYQRKFLYLKGKYNDLYLIADTIERSAELMFQDTFSGLLAFLDVLSDLILEKNNVKPDDITSAEDICTAVDAKLKYLTQNCIIAFRYANRYANYNCRHSSEKPAIREENAIMFLIVLYNNAVRTKKEGQKPEYDDTFMPRCIGCMNYLIKNTLYN